MDNDVIRPAGEAPEDVPSVPGGVPAELPNFMSTVQSQNVQVVGDATACPACVRYGGEKGRFNLIWGDACRGDTPEITVFSDLMNSGDLDDDEGIALRTFVLPIDVVDLDGGYGLIVDTDLRGFARGIPDVQSADSAALHALSELCETAEFLAKKSLSLSDWSGDDLYFNLENGVFRLLLNGRNLIAADSAPSGHPAQSAVVELLRRALLGSEPDQRLQALPAPLHGMLQADADAHSLQEWIAALNAPAQASGESVPEEQQTGGESAPEEQQASGESAPEEQQTGGESEDLTPVSERLSLWEVSRNGERWFLVLPRRTTLLGCTVSPLLPAEPFAKMLFNEKKNVLGLRNLSKTEWICEFGNTRARVMPGAICVLTEGMRLTPAGDKALCLTLKRLVSESKLIGG